MNLAEQLEQDEKYEEAYAEYKKQMVQKMGKQAAPITEQDAFSMDALTLAYMGDVVWSLFIRDTLIHTGIYQVQILSTLTSEIGTLAEPYPF